MKTLLILLTTVLLTTTANAQFYEGWPAKWAFGEKSIDLGTLKKGTTEKVSLPFVYEGKKPLVIKGYKSSSKGIEVMLPKEPIKPGSKSEIIFKYTTGKTGKFEEKIMFETNAQKEFVVLNFYGVVK